MNLSDMSTRTNNLLRKVIFLLICFVSQIFYSQSEQGFTHFYHGIEVGMNWTNPEFMINESAEPDGSLGLSYRLYGRARYFG